MAGRVFAFELLDTTISRKDEDVEKAPIRVLTPTGGLFNRIIICGTLMDKDHIQGKSEFWLGKLNDRTGTVIVSAGEYNPEGMSALSAIEGMPIPVAVIGKPNIYERDGDLQLSIKIESINVIPIEEVNKWIFDTAVATVKRLDDLKAESTKNAQDASNVYGTTEDDINRYKDQVIGVLKTLLPRPKPQAVESEDVEIIDMRPKK